MIVNQATLGAAYKGFKTIFNEVFTAVKARFQQLATVVPSTDSSEEYKWLGKIPRMREWLGERIIQNLTAHGYSVKNKDWEATVEVDRNDVEDDKLGLYRPVIEQIATAAATHPDEIVFGLLHAGFSTLCFDGQYFFDTDHVGANGTSQSNTGTGALTVARYAAARAQMMALTDEAGKNLGVIPGLLVVSGANEEMGRQICYADQINGTTNVWKGTAQLLVLPELAGNPAEWFLLDVSKPVKPFVFQQRKVPQFVALDQPTDQNVFMQKQFLYGTDCRDNAGYGLWQLAYGSTGAVA